MTAGPVNRALLESFFQQPGQVYSDSMTESAMDVLADQSDENWTAQSLHRTAAVIDHPDGSITNAKIANATLTLDKFAPSELTNDTQNGLAIIALKADVTQRAINVMYPPAPVVATKGDGVTDDTAAINSIINSVTSGTIYFPPGTYLLSKQGTRLLTYSNTQRGYGILLLNKSNITLEFAPGAVLKMPIGDASVFNGIWAEGCDNVDILNPSFIGTGTTTTRILEEGIGITITTSTRITVDNPLSTNLRGCVRAYNSSNITIKNGFSSIYANEHTSAHFSLYTSKDSLIDHCVSYGATMDGDIFVYGSGSVNCTIQDCRAHSYVYGDNAKTIFNNTAQGIQIDASGRDCKILDCYAYGYYYGFDFKNNSEGGLIQGNTAERCKVGISARKGEGGTIAPVNMLTVSDNIVIPNGGNGNNVAYIGTLAGPFGMAIMDVYGGCNIEGNQFYNSQDIVANQNFIGLIIGISDDVSDSYQGGFSITGNNFSFDNRMVGTNFGQNQNQAIIITSQYRVISVLIDGNQFDLPYNGMLTNAIEATNVQGLIISNNNFSDYNTTGKPVIKFTGCQRININGNTFGYHWGLVEGYTSQAIGFTGNVSAESINPTATASVFLSNCQWINIIGNTQLPITASNKDSFYYQDAAGSNWVNMQTNILHLINKTPTTYFSSVAANFSFTNNVVG
jgi:hypothetical protein